MTTNGDRASLDKLGRLLIEHFKDESLFWFNKLCKGECKGPIEGLQVKVKALDKETQDIIAACITDAVIRGLHDFLFAVDEINNFEKDIQIFVDRKNIVDLSDDIYGELFTSDGWEARFSKYPTDDQNCIKYNIEADLPYFTEEDTEEFVDLLDKGEIEDYDDIDRLLEEQQKRSVERHKDENKKG